MKYLILFLPLFAACGITDSTGSLSDRKPQNRTLTIAAVRDSTVSESEWSDLIGRASSVLESRINVRLRNAGSVQVGNPPTSIYVVSEFAEKAGLHDSDIYFSVSNRRSEEVIGSKGIAGQAVAIGGREGFLFGIRESRSTMVLIHEIGHMIGMGHSSNPQYLMDAGGHGRYLTKDYAARMDALFRSDCSSGSCPKRGKNVQSCTWSDDQ